MKVIFTEARELIDKRIVAAGEEVDVSDADGAAFIQYGHAKAASAAKAPSAIAESK